MSINLTTLIQVMPYAQNVANAEVIQPHVQQAVAAQQAQETLRKDQNQVQKTEKQDKAETVKDDRQGRGAGQFASGRRRQKKTSPEPETETASNASPWSGNILDRKV